MFMLGLLQNDHACLRLRLAFQTMTIMAVVLVLVANSIYKNQDSTQDDVENNNGEVQYSPVLLHIDLCCILFGILTFEVEDDDDEQICIPHAKRFLVEQLLPLLQEYPNQTYSVHFGDNWALLRDWLEELVLA